MSDPTTAPPAGRFRRLRPLAAPFLRVWRWFYYAPRTVQVGLVLVLTVGLGVGAYFGNSYLKRRTAEREVSGGWRQFEDAARKVDVEGMNAGLDRVLAARPGDPVAERRKAGLAALSADENDPELAVVLVNYHVAHDRLPAAAREARKVLTKFPKDWRAICVLAHNALQTERDLGACKKWLDELPAPDDPGARLDVGGLLYAIRLSDVVGRDATPLRGLIVRRLLPLLRGQSAGEAPPQVKAQLIESYLQPFADPAEAGELAGYWGDVSRLHERAVAEAAESGDVTTLLRVGGLAPRLEAALAVIRDYQVKSVPADPPEEHDAKVKELDDRFAVLVREVNDRTRRAWQAVRERDPTRPEPYLGLYRIARREKDAAGMVRALQDGLVACG